MLCYVQLLTHIGGKLGMKSLGITLPVERELMVYLHISVHSWWTSWQYSKTYQPTLSVLKNLEYDIWMLRVCFQIFWKNPLSWVIWVDMIWQSSMKYYEIKCGDRPTRPKDNWCYWELRQNSDSLRPPFVAKMEE
jgi:hypothetical protein